VIELDKKNIYTVILRSGNYALDDKVSEKKLKEWTHNFKHGKVVNSVNSKGQTMLINFALFKTMEYYPGNLKQSSRKFLGKKILD
jgi:hypothetical protein